MGDGATGDGATTMTMAMGDDNDDDGDSAMGNEVDNDGDGATGDGIRQQRQSRWRRTTKTTSLMATVRWAMARWAIMATTTTMVMGDDDDDDDDDDCDGVTGNKVDDHGDGATGDDDRIR